MGNRNSTRWKDYQAKRFTDSAFCLDSHILSGLKLDDRLPETLLNCQVLASEKLYDEFLIVYCDITRNSNDELVLLLRYLDAIGQYQESHILIDQTVQPLSGKRNWFLCPQWAGSSICMRRTGKLYLPRDAKGFACRHCHNLTYGSTRKKPQLNLWSFVPIETPEELQMAVMLQALERQTAHKTKRKFLKQNRLVYQANQ